MTAELRSHPPLPVGTPTTGTKRPARPFNVAKWATLGVWAVLVVWSILGLDIKWSRLLEAPADLYRLFELMFTQLECVGPRALPAGDVGLDRDGLAGHVDRCRVRRAAGVPRRREPRAALVLVPHPPAVQRAACRSPS